VVATSDRTDTRSVPPLGPAIADLLGGDDLPVRIESYDGSAVGDPHAATKIVVRSPEALQYILTAPGELGFARAYVAGDIDLVGDIFEAIALRDRLPNVKLRPAQWLAIARIVGRTGLHRPPVPPEEARLHGRRHSRERDAAAISHHYDVSNEFYELVLGPSMTYSCAVWPSADATLEAAQAAKYDLVCRKLGLRPGMRLLDVGCGWGGMVMHAARHYGVRAVGVTLSGRQAEYAKQAVKDARLDDVEIRVQDYRDVDGRFDAISSIGMFEHVGFAKLGVYFTHLYDILEPGGRLLNHGISRPAGHRPRFPSRGFI
jgi:cyclopropane-fatty-acyl-phospholipid synthase